MKRNKKIISLLLVLALSISAVFPVLADVAVGDTVAILGENLSDEEKQALLKEFGATDATSVITISNAEEHEALGELIPAAQIGTRAISSVMITYKEPGSGLNVRMSHITYVTPQSYADALTTLGITDADIFVSAPYDVSGTAALTGIMKGFEKLTGQTIDEDLKDAVNEEALVSTDLSHELTEGDTSHEEAQNTVSTIISNIKVEINNRMPQSTEEIEQIVRDVLNDLQITISDDLYQRLVDLFDKMKDLDIDWGHLAQDIEEGANRIFQDLLDTAQSEEAKGFFQKIGQWFSDLWVKIKELFQ